MDDTLHLSAAFSANPLRVVIQFLVVILAYQSVLIS